MDMTERSSSNDSEKVNLSAACSTCVAGSSLSETKQYRMGVVSGQTRRRLDRRMMSVSNHGKQI